MIETIVRNVIQLGFAIVIFTIGILVTMHFGEKKKVRKAGFEALRWFTAGTIVAAVADIWLSGSTSSLFIPGVVAILALIWVEYYLLLEEEKAENQWSETSQ